MKNKRDRLGILRACIFFLSILILIALFVAFAMAEEQGKKKENQNKETENLVIIIPETCSTGTVTVECEGKVLYQYKGEINIKNDGANGKEIEIVAEYPPGSGWPCSCFEENE